MKEEKILKIFGQIGIGLLIVVAVYLVLKIFGFVHSIGPDEILTTAVFGALFYVGYSYRAIEEIKDLKKRVRKIEKKLKIQ